ncbi:MAG TPA: helix-hairpin-helix domain-containing protein [Acidimicrobiia bacterium]
MPPRSRLPPAWLQAAGLLAAAAASGVLLARPGVLPTASTSSVTVIGVADPEAITVHVAGWVAVPGLVELAPSARVADAVAAAGGLRPGAAIEQLNLAAPVRDGDQVVVPGPAEAEAPGSPAGSAGQGGPVRLNQASAQDLEGLPGVGPVLAERIIAYRDEHGPFEEVEDLLDVPGIGESKLAALRDLIVP